VSEIWLAANGGNEHIEALLAAGDVPVDRVKVGLWMDDDQLTTISRDYDVLLHISEGLIWPRSKRWMADRLRRARLLRAPWVSFHLDLGSNFLAYRWSGSCPIRPALGRRWAVRTLRRLVGRSPYLVLAENMPRWEESRPAYIVDPAFIRGVVEEAGCHFLLDLAHARVSACNLGQDARDYIAQLPLDRLVEIHVSGPRPSPEDGRLTDAHQPLQREDYALLAWVLERTSPRAVTLEYIRDRPQLEEQLRRLRRML
jgi:uncharacterized protein DUF692